MTGEQGKRIATHLAVVSPAGSVGGFCFAEMSTGHPHLRNDGGAGKTDCRAPYGSVGASVLQRCPPDTRTAMTGRQLIAHFTVVVMTKRLVILSAKRERIRNTLK